MKSNQFLFYPRSFFNPIIHEAALSFILRSYRKVFLARLFRIIALPQTIAIHGLGLLTPRPCGVQRDIYYSDRYARNTNAHLKSSKYRRVPAWWKISNSPNRESCWQCDFCYVLSFYNLIYLVYKFRTNFFAKSERFFVRFLKFRSLINERR